MYNSAKRLGEVFHLGTIGNSAGTFLMMLVLEDTADQEDGKYSGKVASPYLLPTHTPYSA